MPIIDNRTAGRDYPLPHPDNKLKDDVLRDILTKQAIDADITAILLAIAAKAAIDHGHVIGDVTGLTDALANKISVGYHDALGDLSDVNVVGAANGQVLIRQADAWIPVALQIGNITNLETALDLKAPLLSPALTGTPTAPTQTPGNSSTRLATTAFVGTALFNFGTLINQDIADLYGSRVDYTEDQGKTAAEQGQARANIGAGVLAGHRNKIINGDFDLWQRGTNAAVAGYLADRWQVGNTGNTALAISQQSFTPGQTFVPGNPKYFERVQFTSAAGAGNYTLLLQKIEGVQTLAGKKATLTFYARADSTRNIGVEILQEFGTGGSPSPAVSLPQGLKAIATGNVWQKFQVVVDIPSIAGKTLGTTSNNYLMVGFWLNAGSTWNARASSVGQGAGGQWFEIAHVSLVEGDATADPDPYPPRHINEEVALCRRYYENATYGWTMYAAAGNGFGSYVPLLATKRAVPTLTNTPTGVINCNTTTISTSSNTHLVNNATAAATGTVQHVGTYTADAEL